MEITITPELEEKLQPLLNQRYNAASDFMEVSYKQDSKTGNDYYNGVLPIIANDTMIPAIDRTCYKVVEHAQKDLLEIFTSGDGVVSFAPLNGEDAYSAKASTQLVNQIFLRDNNGEALLQDALKMALIEGSAIFKAWWSEDEKTTRTVKAQGLTDQEEAKEYLIGLRESGIEFEDENAEYVENKDGTFDLTLTYTFTRKRVKVELVPIEEFVIEPAAKSISSANYMCHRTLKSKEQLKDYGLTEEELSELNLKHSDLSAWTINAARTNYRQNLDDDDGSDSNDTAYQTYIREHHWRSGEISDDGSVRLYRILQLDDGKIFKIYEEFSYPFYPINPIPVANNVFGSSWCLSVADIQADRAWALQAFYTYAHKVALPQWIALRGQFDQRSLMNPVPSAVFEVDTMGAIQPVPLPPMPPIDAILALTDKELEERTGMSFGTASISTNALESGRMSEGSVNNLITLSTGRVRSLARSIANGGFSDLFRAIYSLYKDNSDRPIPVRTAYGIQEIAPNQLVDRDHLVINVALTTQEKAKKAQSLNALLDWIGKVNSISSPFIQPTHQAWMINEMGEALGWPNVYDYSTPLQQIQPPQPDPMVMAQLENIQSDSQLKQAQAQKLIGDDHLQTEDLLFKQQLAGKQEARADLELQFKMRNAVDEGAHKNNKLAADIKAEALKNQHAERRQATEEFNAKTKNLKVQADIIQNSQKQQTTK